jgi:ComF family protein
MKQSFLSYLDDFIWMMYPSLCAACGKPLFHGEECICTPCRFHLPRTNYHLFTENPVIRHFWGKVKIEKATAYYYFNKGERVQRLIHQLKYKGRKDVGVFIGNLLGIELRNSEYNMIDIVIPVPLHISKLKKRGYNQSDCFAEGLAAGLKKEFSSSLLIRKQATETQTRKHRFERYKNVDNIFSVDDESYLIGKNVLLVDDVITTGSTLISCAEVLFKIPGTKIFVAAMACA